MLRYMKEKYVEGKFAVALDMPWRHKFEFHFLAVQVIIFVFI